MNKKTRIDKAQLRMCLSDVYWNEGWTLSDIREVFGIPNPSLVFRKLSIPTRSPKENFRVRIMRAVRFHNDPNIDYYSRLERRFRNAVLHKFGLYKGIDWEHDVKLIEGRRITADFLLWSWLDIECDEEYWHQKFRRKQEERDRLVEDAGYSVIRFTGTDIRKNIELVRQRLLERIIKFYI